jgi:hypothetical protein
MKKIPKIFSIAFTIALFSGCVTTEPHLYSAESRNESRKNLKEWEPRAMKHLGEGVAMKVKARKYGNEVFVLVEIEPVSPELLKERENAGLFGGASFTVKFLDEDGFTILEESFSLNSITLIVDDNQEPLSFEYQGCNGAFYLREMS